MPEPMSVIVAVRARLILVLRFLQLSHRSLTTRLTFPLSLSFCLNKSAHVREKHSAFYSAALGGFNPSKLIPFSRSIAHSLCFVLHQLGYVQPALSLGAPVPLRSLLAAPESYDSGALPNHHPSATSSRRKAILEPVYKELLIARAAPICINQF